MTKTTRTPAIVDLPDVNGAFVGNIMRPFTREEFSKLKAILTKKRKRSSKLVVTNNDLRAAGLGHLIAESANGKSRQ